MRPFKVKVDGRYWVQVRVYDTYDAMYKSVQRRWKLNTEKNYRAMFIPITDRRDPGFLGELVFTKESNPGANTVSHEATHAVSWLICRKGWKHVFRMKGFNSESLGGRQQEKFATMVGELTGAIGKRIW